MEKQNEIKIFEDKKVRTLWDTEHEKWYLSIIDVIEILTGSPRPRKYWNALKTKLKAEGSELSQNLGQLKMQSIDGKFYLTDVADTKLTKEEQAILDSFETGEWIPIKNRSKRKAELIQYAAKSWLSFTAKSQTSFLKFHLSLLLGKPFKTLSPSNGQLKNSPKKTDW